MEKRIEMVHFQITKNCNLRCWFCGQWGKKGFFADEAGKAMEFFDWIRISDELAEYRKKTGISPFIMLWGGEPLIAPFFEDIAQYLKSQGFKVGMVTNGTLIGNHIDVIRKRIDTLYVSIDGPCEIHDAIRGEGMFLRVCENLEQLKHKNVIVMSVVTGELMQNIERFLEQLKPLGIKELYLQDMIGLSSEEVAAYKSWMKSAFGIEATNIDSWENNNLEVFDTENEVKRFFDKYDFNIVCKKHGNRKQSSCLSPFRHPHIAWNGNVLYCTDFYDFSAGNVHDASLLEIFEGELSEKYRNEIMAGHCSACKNCSWQEKTDYQK